jgi:tRNA G18 (ribose-2'-O)-methylase SpoU
MNILYGINTVTEALKARGRAFEWIGVATERKDIRLKRVIDECRKIGVQVRFLTRVELDKLAGNAAHQGLVAVTSAKQYNDLEDLLAARRAEHSLIVVLDGVEDPHNLGAILRTADAAGADGVVVPDRRAAGVTGTVAKVRWRERTSPYRQSHKHLALARRVEEKWPVDLSACTNAGRKRTTRLITKRIARWCLAPKARDCTTWCVSTAIFWFRSRCSDRFRR